jgi:hypothetical protein
MAAVTKRDKILKAILEYRPPAKAKAAKSR